ncbi:MAG: hypothetical protein JWN98_1849 [Abditibacteriota bacterium]|nr:hypothetical protein [Abditibacteriota bacterium]
MQLLLSEGARPIRVRNRWSGPQMSWAKLWLCAMLLMIGSFVVAARPVAAVPIQVTYTDGANEGFNDATLGASRRRAFEAAAASWGAKLRGTVPVEISAKFDPLGGSSTSATLGRAGPTTFLSDWGGSSPPPLADTYYAVALGNQLAGTDLNPGEADISATFNSDVDNDTVLSDSGFYYGTDGRAGSDIDFYSVCMHEFGHGLGFVAFIEPDGSFDQNAISIFDRFLANGSSSTAMRLVDMAQTDRAPLLIGDSLFFAGPNTRSANGGANARLYAPSTYSSGSSVSHLDESTFTGINEMMTPFSSSVAHEPGPVASGVFKDMGWGFGTSPAPTPTPIATATPTSPPVSEPANNDFVRALVLSGNTGRVSGSNSGADKESGEPSHAQNAGGKSVWYRWTAPSNGRVTFSTASSTLDTVMAIYTGSSVSGLQVVAQNDDASDTDRTSSATINTVGGRVYHIAVDGYNNTAGSIVLNWTFIPAAVTSPPNDLFAKAINLTPAGRLQGSNMGATRESGEPNHAGIAGGRSVWYTWRAPSSARWTFNLLGSSFDTLLAVYTGTTITALKPVASSDNAFGVLTSSVTFNAAAGTLYRIAVDGRGGQSGAFSLLWAPTPLNDDFANAVTVSGNSGKISGNNTGATREIGEHGLLNLPGNRSIWYSWTAPASGIATIFAKGSTFDTLLGIYTGARVNSLRLIASNNDVSATDSTSSVSFNAVAGTVYRISLDGATGATGVGVLQWSLVVPPPPNDLFAKAQNLPGSVGSAFGSNINGTRESGELKHAGTGGSRSIWYRWTAPGPGALHLSTKGSAFDTVMAVYTGTAVSTLRVVKSNDDVSDTDSSSSLSFNVVPGTTYSIAIDGFNDAGRVSTGSLKLTYVFKAGQTLANSVATKNATRSTVALSTAEAQSASGSVQLSFTSALDAAAASDVGNYTVEVNGEAVAIESIRIQNTGRAVSLLLPEAAFNANDLIRVTWNLRDGAGRTVSGAAGLFAAR